MFDANQIYGQVGGAAPTAAPLTTAATDDMASGLRGIIDPRNPLTWLAGILLVTFGAAGAAGSVRLGPARVAAGVGRS